MTRSVIEQLLEQDGIHVPEGGGQNRMVRCPVPAHNDKHESCSVNVATNEWNCHGCGQRGGTFLYLRIVRGLRDKEIFHTLEDMGLTEKQINHAAGIGSPKESNWAKWVPNIIADNVQGGRMVMQHTYRDRDGKVICIAARYGYPAGKDGPKLLPHIPAHGNGYYVCWPHSGRVKEGDAPSHTYLRKPILYRLPEVLAAVATGRPVMLVEGEKCADLIADLPDTGRPMPVPTTIMQAGDPQKADLSPLKGAKVMLVADPDDTGRRKCMLAADAVLRQTQDARVLLPQEDSKIDIGDVAVRSGWSGVVGWMNDAGGLHKWPVPSTTVAKPKKDDTAEDKFLRDKLVENDHYRVLGVGEGVVYIQIAATWEVITIGRRQCASPQFLLEIAPLEFWRSIYDNPFDRTNTFKIANAILRTAEMAGFIDMTRVYGRGANRGRDGKLHWNLGDRLLVQGDGRLMDREMRLGDMRDTVYAPAAPLVMKPSRKAPEFAADLCEAICRYRWIKEEHARVFLGFMAICLVGGALPARPMVWLRARSQVGKSFLLSHVVRPFLSPLLIEVSQGTEAYLAQKARSEAVPVYVDEFEPDSMEAGAWQKILHLVRISTTDGGQRGRGAPGGDTLAYSPRFCLLASSIRTGRLQEADRNRFLFIGLSPTGVSDWPAVERAIHRACAIDRLEAVRTWCIENAPTLVLMAAEDARNLSEIGFATRDAQIAGAISAGWRWLSGEEYTLVPEKAEATTDTDGLMAQIFGFIVRQADGYTATVGDLCLSADPDHYGCNQMKLLAQHGLKPVGSKCHQGLLIATTAPGFMAMMKGSLWERADPWPTLEQMDGVRTHDPAGNRMRTRVGGARRICVHVMPDALVDAGLIDHGNMFSQD